MQEQSSVEATWAKNGSLPARYWMGLVRNGTSATSNFSSVWAPSKLLATNIFTDLPYYTHW